MSKQTNDFQEALHNAIGAAITVLETQEQTVNAANIHGLIGMGDAHMLVENGEIEKDNGERKPLKGFSWDD